MTRPDRGEFAALPEIDETSFRHGVCDFCYRESAVAAVANIHQATGGGWSVVACRACIDDSGNTGRQVRLLRREDAVQTRMLQEIHDRRAAAKQQPREEPGRPS